MLKVPKRCWGNPEPDLVASSQLMASMAIIIPIYYPVNTASCCHRSRCSLNNPSIFIAEVNLKLTFLPTSIKSCLLKSKPEFFL